MNILTVRLNLPVNFFSLMSIFVVNNLNQSFSAILWSALPVNIKVTPKIFDSIQFFSWKCDFETIPNRKIAKQKWIIAVQSSAIYIQKGGIWSKLNDLSSNNWNATSTDGLNNPFNL